MRIDYLINFDFDEVNAAVFRNAQLYMRKKQRQDNICVIVPYQFRALYSQADVVAVIPKKTCERFGIDEYKKVLEYVEEGVSPKDMSFFAKIRKKLRSVRKIYFEQILIRLAGSVGKDWLLRVYKLFWFSARQRRYFINNGLERYCLESVARKYPGFQYIRVGDYLDAIDLSLMPFHLGKWFQKNFAYLYTMIAEGNLYRSELAKDHLLSRFGDFASSATVRYVKNFFVSSRPKIILRTRNFKSKATMNNSKLEALKPLAESLLEKGAMVLNLGYPLLELGIKHELYCEVEHSLTFEEELAMCQAADAVATTGRAGLFTGFAASAITLVQIDEEWSQSNLEKPVPLFEARAKAGLKDIDVRGFLQKGEFGLAAQTIVENLQRGKESRTESLKNVDANQSTSNQEIYEI